MNPPRITLLALCLGLLLAGLYVPLHAAVNDVFPGDYFPSRPGATTVSLYAYDRAQAGPYRRGDKLSDSHIDSSVLALRLVHAVRMNETTIAGVVALPWINANVSPAPLATLLGKRVKGLTDLRLGLTAWVINDPASANYLGITGMVVAPTGTYEKRQVINPGENRWKFILGGGWQKDITPRFLIELSPEIAFFGDNDDYVVNRQLEQRPSYALTGYLRYRASPTWHVHVGGQINRGGETRINGLDQHNPANNDRVMAGMAWFLPGQQQIILRVARDTAIENGFLAEREVVLRYQAVF